MATALLSPSAKQQFFDNAGAPAAGFKLFTYAAGTTNPQATFLNRAGSSANDNPIILDNRGEAIIYLTPGLMYDYALTKADLTPVWTRDNVSADAGDADAVMFTQSGTGAIPRTTQNKLRESVSVMDFGAAGDGSTDDLLAISTALAAADGREVILPAGTYLLSDAFDLPSGSRIRGAGMERTIIKRSASATATYMLGIIGQDVAISDLTVDGNSLANPNPAHNILVSGGGHFTFANFESRYAKGSGATYGCGIAVHNTTDADGNTYSSLINVTCSDNDVHGLYISDAGNWSVSGGAYVRNGVDGISVYTSPAPTIPTDLQWSIVGSTAAFNTGSGIGVGGFEDELDHPSSYGNAISACNIHHNRAYGIVYQSNACSITGNAITHNGNSDFNGGVLLNAQRVSMTGNTIADNSHYGVDAGGAYDLVFTGNVVKGNFGPGGGGSGINLGATQRAVVSGNQFSDNGGSGGGENIGVRAYDGGSSSAAFRTRAGRITIVGNQINLANTLQHGILLTKGDPDHVTVKDNAVYGGVIARAYKYEARFVANGGNIWSVDGTAADYLMAPADPLIIPDDGADSITLNGASATINNVKTVSSAAWEGKVRSVRMTTFGSGYLTAPTVTLTGGAGVGATASAIIVNGEVRAIEILTPGSGYTSAPTVGISGGGGSGAAATSQIGCPNFRTRTVRLRNNSAGTIIKNGTGNVLLGSSDYAPATDRGALVLEGVFGSGNWYEVSRSG